MKCRRKACKGVEMVPVDVFMHRKGTKGYISLDGETIQEITVSPERGLVALAMGMDRKPFKMLRCLTCGNLRFTTQKKNETVPKNKKSR